MHVKRPDYMHRLGEEKGDQSQDSTVFQKAKSYRSSQNIEGMVIFVC